VASRRADISPCILDTETSDPWMRALTALRGSRLVIALDDLDRCPDARAIEVLKTVDALAARAIQGTLATFVVALDEDRARLLAAWDAWGPNARDELSPCVQQVFLDESVRLRRSHRSSS
jgi:hypothetical protein